METEGGDDGLKGDSGVLASELAKGLNGGGGGGAGISVFQLRGVALVVRV